MHLYGAIQRWMIILEQQVGSMEEQCGDGLECSIGRRKKIGGLKDSTK